MHMHLTQSPQLRKQLAISEQNRPANNGDHAPESSSADAAALSSAHTQVCASYIVCFASLVSLPEFCAFVQVGVSARVQVEVLCRKVAHDSTIRCIER